MTSDDDGCVICDWLYRVQPVLTELLSNTKDLRTYLDCKVVEPGCTITNDSNSNVRWSELVRVVSARYTIPESYGHILSEARKDWNRWLKIHPISRLWYVRSGSKSFRYQIKKQR